MCVAGWQTKDVRITQFHDQCDSFV